ncbi:MAG: flagellar hook capping FlgD N-terminal domain-containing protein [Gemmatimonadaceae bacterium]
MITLPTKSPVFDTTTSTSTAAAAAASATAAQPGGAMGKDAFMKLLIAQMQNQDPTNPMDGSQMAAQLAQFSSLEQLQQINTTLTGQSTSSGSLLGAIQSSAAINTIGHTVIAVGNQVSIGGDSGATSVQVNVASSAASGTLHVVNSAGVEVGTSALGPMSAGKQSINLSDAEKGLPAGTYTFSVDAKDTAGNAVATQTYMSGVVDGIASTSSGIVLSSGGLAIPYASVIQIIK